jgi:DNA-directed RNA polymerase subunit RPC12/RpoP
MPHPGDDWPRVCPRDPQKLAFMLGGRRSIHAAWPPTAVCETCGQHFDSGYIGPVAGDRLTFPAPETQFICEPCARRLVGLRDDELTGHMCQECNSDVDHVEVHLVAYGFGAFPDVDRLHQVGDPQERGWVVVGMEQLRPIAMGERWLVRLRVPRLLAG